MIVLASVMGYLFVGGVLAMLAAYHGCYANRWDSQQDAFLAIPTALFWPIAIWAVGAQLTARAGETRRRERELRERELARLLKEAGL